MRQAANLDRVEETEQLSDIQIKDLLAMIENAEKSKIFSGHIIPIV